MARMRLGSENEFKHSPSVAVNAGGKVHAVYRGTDEKIHYRRWTRKGWDAEETLPSPAPKNYHAHVVAAPDGTPHVVFMGELGNGSASYAIFYTARRDKVWSEPVRLSSEAGAQVPRLAIGADGVMHIVYSSFGTNKFYYTHNRGGGWRTPQQAGSGLVPEIAVGADGAAHVVWMAPKKPYGIFYARVALDGTWSAPVKIAKKHEQQLPTLALDSQGRVHIAWYRGDNGTNRLAYARLDADGSKQTLADAQGTLALATFSRIGVDCADRVHLVYQAKTSPSEVWRVYRRVLEGEAWSEPARLDVPPLDGQCQVPDVSANGKILALAWCDSDTDSCYADVMAIECGGTLSLRRRGQRRTPGSRKPHGTLKPRARVRRSRTPTTPPVRSRRARTR